jgi:hypothetical protein
VQALTRLYREARRRKVFRTAALYVVGAWAALQAADLMFPGFGIPEAAIRAAIWAAVLGFPLALVFGWLFEVGPGGVRRTPPATAGEAAEPRPLARRDYALLAAFAAIALTLVYQAVRGSARRHGCCSATPKRHSPVSNRRFPRAGGSTTCGNATPTGRRCGTTAAIAS